MVARRWPRQSPAEPDPVQEVRAWQRRLPYVERAQVLPEAQATYDRVAKGDGRGLNF